MRHNAQEMQESEREGPWNWDPKRAFRTPEYKKKKILNRKAGRTKNLHNAQREILLVLFSEKERAAFLSMEGAEQEKFVLKVFAGR